MKLIGTMVRWMSPELSNIIDRVVNDCKIYQKFQKSIARSRLTLPKVTSEHRRQDPGHTFSTFIIKGEKP